ncbi:MAG: restriction endonuclease subunit S [Cellulosilyticaceae bacterium]
MSFSDNLKGKQILEAIREYREIYNLPNDPKIKELSDYEISRLPHLPNEWFWAVSNQISTFITNGVHAPTSGEDELGIKKRMLRITDLNDGQEPDFNKLPYCKRFVKGDYEKTIKKNDIYISFTGNKLGKRYLVKEDKDDVVFAHYFVRWQPIIVDVKYIYYVLLSYHFDRFMYEHTLGSTQPNLKVTDLKRVPLPIPPLEEQKAIANILSSLDEKIELNNQMNKTLEEMAQALFKRWFVDFEFPNEDGDPYKSSGGEMVESELGMIPKRWEITELDTIGNIVAGGTPSTKNEEYYDGNIPWITPRDLSGYSKKFISKGERSITELGLQKSSAKLMPKNTVLFSSRAPIGYVVISNCEVCTNQGFKSIVCDENKISYNYIYWLLKIEKEKIESVASGSTFKEVSGKTMKEYKIILPKKVVLDKFTNVTNSFDSLIKKNEVELDKLEEIRATLLPKLMSGEIRVNV